ncbi:MAG: amidohydrolase [Bacteroidota bacterium]
MVLLLPILFTSCDQKQQADLIVVNANIYTVNEAFDKAEAFAVKDGKFIAVGTSEAIQKDYDAPQVIDAEGKTVVPGLIDAHCHFYGLGLTQQRVNLVGTQSFEEVLERTLAFQNEKNMPFIQGRGWDQNDWEVKTFPDKTRLDELFPDTPVALERIDGHAYLVNQKALDMAGITPETNAEGGAIELKDGQLTGILVDNPMQRVDAVIPKPTEAMKIQALLDAQQLCINYGLTTVNDAGLNKEMILLIDSLQQAGKLNMRIYAMVSNTEEDLDYFLTKGIVKTAQLNVRSIKVYADGALGSRGAALKTPYADKPGHVGAMVTPPEAIQSLADRIAATDYQMNTHAIGDAANSAVLEAYEKALQGKEDRRWKIEHAQIVDPADFDRFANGIIPSVQPTHATSDMYWAEDRLGEARMEGAYAFKTMLDKAGTIALGTDFPVEKVSPFLTFYAAVARKDTKNYPESGFQMKDALSREEALKGMTIWAAYSNFEEGEKGSIEVGKFADFTVLDKDIMQIPIEDVPGITATQTFIGGKQLK